MPVPPPAEPARLPALDGLRTVAVLSVFGYHALPQHVWGGQLGVDVFFVLSGLVITRLLLREQQRHSTIRLRTFYVRRWLRLMPALAALFVVVEVATLVLPYPETSPVTNLWALVYLMNIYRAVTGDGGGAMGHTWSLGVEDQFYLAWPLLLIGLIKLRLRPRSLALVVLGGAVLSGVAGFVLNTVPGQWFRIYNGPDTRAVQLLLGCAIAVLVSSPELARVRAVIGRGASYAVWPALALMGLAVARYPVQVEAGSAWQLVVPALLSGIIILALLDATHPVSRLLAWRPLAAAGARYSYAFYLWHYPVIFLLHRYEPPGPWKRAVLSLFLTAVATWLSYVLVERPVSRWAQRRARRKPLPVPAPGDAPDLALVAVGEAADVPTSSAGEHPSDRRAAVPVAPSVPR